MNDNESFGLCILQAALGGGLYLLLTILGIAISIFYFFIPILINHRIKKICRMIEEWMKNSR